MNFANKIKRKINKKEHQNHQRVSYSQSGEDIIIDYILGWMGSKTRTYLDIGAHHPTYLSNTYLFYENGHRGVSVEPDPSLFEKIKSERPGDTNLNVGVGSVSQGTAKFYVMKPTTLNTFSKKEAGAYIKHYPDTKIEKIVELPLIGVNDLLDKHFKQASPDFLTLDVEGLDFEIIKQLDFSKYRPKVLCVESAAYEGKNSISKAIDLMAYIQSKQYFLYADTFTNSIFVDKKLLGTSALPKIKPLGIS